MAVFHKLKANSSAKPVNFILPRENSFKGNEAALLTVVTGKNPHLTQGMQNPLFGIAGCLVQELRQVLDVEYCHLTDFALSSELRRPIQVLPPGPTLAAEFAFKILSTSFSPPEEMVPRKCNLAQLLQIENCPQRRQELVDWTEKLETAAVLMTLRMVLSQLPGRPNRKGMGCFFKMANDRRRSSVASASASSSSSSSSSSSYSYLYGGSSPNIELAGKQASNELRAVSLLSEAFFSDPEVYVPPHVVVDMAGFRISAMPQLDLKTRKESQLVYGSEDGGSTILNESPEFFQKLSQATRNIGLAPHPCIGAKMLSRIGAACHSHNSKKKRRELIQELLPPQEQAAASALSLSPLYTHV
eukprot:gb/GEZN01009457.1/.p1 GENE.gb/GEZN01009457.1/~~gb/GEZN01009457.1/.p1  ORF type:complete len:358 (-),score=68.85 gb/GEZN01009457.1/:38-1111(-)